MADSDKYREALQAVAQGFNPIYVDDVIQMIADKHAEVEFQRARRCPCGKHSSSEGYRIWLTDAGHAALRALGPHKDVTP